MQPHSNRCFEDMKWLSLEKLERWRIQNEKFDLRFVWMPPSHRWHQESLSGKPISKSWRVNLNRTCPFVAHNSLARVSPTTLWCTKLDWAGSPEMRRYLGAGSSRPSDRFARSERVGHKPNKQKKQLEIFFEFTQCARPRKQVAALQYVPLIETSDAWSLPFWELIKSKSVMVSVESSCDATSIAKEGKLTKRRPLAPIVEQYHESIRSAKDTVRLLHFCSTREEKIHADRWGHSFETNPKWRRTELDHFSRRKERWGKGCSAKVFVAFSH